MNPLTVMLTFRCEQVKERVSLLYTDLMFHDLHYGMKNVTFQWIAVGCKVVVTTEALLKQKI